MSSPFQQKFSAKSPLNGNYYSGVDGIKYVSPKPGVIDIPQGTKKKEEEAVKDPETKKTFDFGEPFDSDTSITTQKSDFKFGGVPTDTAKIPETPADVITNRENFVNNQTLQKFVPGAKVEKIEKDQKKYLASFEPGFAKDREGTTTIEEYIRKKEDKYKPKTLYQDQEQTGFTENGATTLSDWMNVGKEYEKN